MSRRLRAGAVSLLLPCCWLLLPAALPGQAKKTEEKLAETLVKIFEDAVPRDLLAADGNWSIPDVVKAKVHIDKNTEGRKIICEYEVASLVEAGKRLIVKGSGVFPAEITFRGKKLKASGNLPQFTFPLANKEVVEKIKKTVKPKDKLLIEVALFNLTLGELDGRWFYFIHFRGDTTKILSNLSGGAD